MLEMLDFFILFGAASLGGIVVVIGSILMIGRRITEPRQKLQQRVDNLEEEISNLKSNH